MVLIFTPLLILVPSGARHCGPNVRFEMCERIVPASEGLKHKFVKNYIQQTGPFFHHETK